MLNIPTITKNLLIANVVCYLLTLVMGPWMNANFGLHFFLASNFQVYQLFTYMFMHGGLTHLLFNMFALWMFGSVVEQVFGQRRFVLFYLVCGIGAGLFQEMAQYVQLYNDIAANNPEVGFLELAHIVSTNNLAPMLNGMTTVGASGAIYGIVLAFGMTFPDERIFIIPIPFPIKAKWFVMGYAAIEVFSAMATPGDGVAHLAHLGGMVVGYFLIRYWRTHPYGGRRSWHKPNMFGGGGGGGWTIGGGGGSSRQRSGGWGNWKSRGGSSTHGSTHSGSHSTTNGSTGNPDWDYNARQRANQAETDRILDKIRRSGYDSLTAAEKQHLFDNSKK